MAKTQESPKEEVKEAAAPMTKDEEVAKLTQLVNDLADYNSQLGAKIDTIRDERRKLVAEIRKANDRLAELGNAASRGISATADGSMCVVTGREVLGAVMQKFGG